MPDDSHICHIIIPSRDWRKSKIFYERVFDGRVEQQVGTGSFDVLPSSGKGISAELNPEETRVVPSIFTSNIEAKLGQIETHGGRRLKDKTPIGKGAEQGYYTLFEDPNGNKMCLYSEK